MTDDLSGSPGERPHYLPELPVAGPQPVGLYGAYVPPPLVPDNEPADRWRWYHAVLAFFGGFFLGQILTLVIGGVWAAVAGVSFDTLVERSDFLLVASAVNQALFIVFAIFIARMTGPVKLRDFGLRRARFWATFWRMAAVMGSYLVLLAVYSEVVNLAPDDAPDRLGASDSDIQMLFFALLVAVVAPIAEEFFFRGFLFRSLCNSMSMWLAAIISGVLFGALHIDSLEAERLLQVVPLAILGVSFALLYSWSGTLFAPIGLHATNNAIAVAAYAEKNDSDFGLMLAGVIWLLMMLACGFGYLLTDRRVKTGVEYAGQ